MPSLKEGAREAKGVYRGIKSLGLRGRSLHDKEDEPPWQDVHALNFILLMEARQ